MRPSQALLEHRSEIARIVERHRARDARVFGSVLSGLDGEDSDLDLLVEPLEGMTLLDLGGIRYELKTLLGVEVDVLTPGALPEGFRAAILRDAKPV